MLPSSPTIDTIAPGDTVATSYTFAGLPGRFCLFYQPEIDLRDGSIRSCEALLRWMHPDYGILRPGASLGGTRWTANISDIEDWAIREVCRQGQAWHDEGHQVQVALNLSHVQLLRPDLLAMLDDALAESGLDPADLTIDAPFTSLAGDPAGFRPIVADVAGRGITVAVDGVGRGVSLGALDGLAATVWKIDLCTRGRRHEGLHPSVEAALAAAHGAGATTVAKAVEHHRLLTEVGNLGFDRAFGHSVGAAVTPGAFREILRRGGARRRGLFGPIRPDQATERSEGVSSMRSR